MTSPRRPTGSRAAAWAAVLLACWTTAACVQLPTRMPTAGPIEEAPGSPTSSGPPGVSFDPKPPQPGASPTEIVTGFFEAMRAAPIRTSVARRFLTADAQGRWSPERSVLTYDESREPFGQSRVSVGLSGLNRYDARGSWDGTRSDRDVTFGLAEVDGEWRIDELPDALIVPTSWFEDWYQRVSLYFFDPSGEVLVPEPVFVPVGDQFAGAMVRGLLDDPEKRDVRVSRTYFPPGIRAGLSVPITPGGVAEVALDGDPDTIDEVTAQRMLTQLVWTLRQEPRLRAVRLTVGGRQVGLPGGPAQVNLDVGRAYDPSGAEASGDLFALVAGRLVRGDADALEATAGPAGAQRTGARSFAVDVPGNRVALVTRDGSTLAVAPVEEEDAVTEPVASGAVDLLQPAWDLGGHLWTVDRAGGSARLLLVADGQPRTITVPGISGRDVRRLLVSRDGSRLVAVVHTRRGDQVRAARLRHDDQGGVLSATGSYRIPLVDSGPEQVIDLAWRSPTSLVAAMAITDDLSQIRILSVDGAPGSLQETASTRVRGATSELVSSPVPAAAVYAVAGRTITDLTTPGRTLPDLPERTTGLAYAG